MLTIGPNGKIKAQVFAKSVIILGEVTGNVTATEKVDIRDNGSVDGDIAAPRVAIAEGAHFRGSIDMQRAGGKPGDSKPGENKPAENKAEQKPAPAAAARRTAHAGCCLAVAAPAVSADHSFAPGVSRRSRRRRRWLLATVLTRLVAPRHAHRSPEVGRQALGSPGPRRRRAGAPRRAGRRLEGLSEVRRDARADATRRSCSTWARSSARTSRSAASGSAASCSSRICSPTSIASCAASRRATSRRRSPTRFSHADASIDGILCWDLFDFLDKAASQALAQQIVRMLRPGGAVMGFFCTTGVERSPFTKFEIVDEQSLRHRYHPGVGGKKQSACRTATSSRCSTAWSSSDSFLLKNNTREMLLRKKA